MASLIANCLARLVKEGRVSPRAAKDAEALHEGMQGRLGQEMGPASADALGALEAARVMAEQARARKVSIAKQAIAFQNASERIAAHPRGTVAGLNAILSRDIFGKGSGANIDSLTEVVFGKADGMFGTGNEALGSKLAGLRQDKELARLVIRENFGEGTGNPLAKEISKAWKDATDYLATRAKAGGKMFTMAEDWRQPQFWQAGRVKRLTEAQFLDRLEPHIRSGGLRVFDEAAGTIASPMKIPSIVKTAYEHITTGGGRGHGVGLAFTPEARTFRFAEGKAGADAYLDLMGEFGPGNDIYAMMRGHLHSGSREIALTELLGPEYRSNFRALVQKARADEKAGRAKKIPILSSAYGAEKTFKMLTGELNAVENDALAGIMSGARGWLTSVQLGGAILSAVPGDMATTLLASRWNGVSGARIIAETARILIADSPDLRAQAARIGVISYAGADTALAQARFADQWLDPNLTGKLANFVIRSQGLQAWTEGLKRVTTMHLLGKVADETAHAFKNVSPEFRRFLDTYGITAKEWDVIRKTPLLDAGDGATFFDMGGVPDQKLADKLMSAIIDERHFFVLEPTAMERAVLAPSAPKGTLTGELARSFGMYKTFAVSMLTTHMMRAAMEIGEGRVGYAIKLAALTTMFGAMAMAMKSIASGKDPREMNNKSFWMAAAIQGGGLGILGDFLNQGFSRADAGLAGTLGGPLAAAIDAGGQLIFKPVANAVAGDETNFGATLARQWKKYLNPTPFYLKTGVDRLFFDQIQTLIDPEYRKSFRRIEQNARQNTGQKFWWRPGETTPSRGPDIGAAFGR